MKEVNLAAFPPRAMEKESQNLKRDLGASENDHFLFTRGGSEAHFQLFLNFFLEVVKETGKNQFLVPATEEAAIFLPLKQVEEFGCTVKELPVDSQGTLLLEGAFKPKTSLLSFSWASALTGVIQPVEEIIQTCHAQGVRVHLDASAIIGKIPFSFQELKVDYLSFDGKNGGGLIQRTPPRQSSVECAPIFPLGVEQQYLEVARLRDALEAELCYTLPDTQVLFQAAHRLPHVSLMTFPGIMSEALLFKLHRKGVFATAKDPSAISFSLSSATTEDDLAYAVDIIVSSVRQLSTLSHAL